MLRVPALEVRDPVPLAVSMESDDGPSRAIGACLQPYWTFAIS